MKKLLVSSLVLLLLALGSTSALADTITLDVANPNLATQGSGPYATFTITGSGTSWTVVATGLNGFVFGDGSVLALNLASGTGTVGVASNCTGSDGSSIACGPFTSGGTGQVDGFGNFSFIVNDGNGFSAPYSSFTLTFTTSDSFLNVAALLAANANGSTAAAHMALGTNTGCTGYAGNGTQPTGSVEDTTNCVVIPEPASMALFGSGLVGLAGIVRRRMKKA